MIFMFIKRIMKSVLASFAAIITSSLCLHAQHVINYPADEPIFSIKFPEEWDVEMGDESVSASSEDEAVNMELFALDAEELEDAITVAKESLAEEFEDLEWIGKPEKGELNGMDVRFLNAKVEIEDVEMMVNCIVFAPKGKATFFMLFNIVPMEVLEDHSEAISDIINSVQAK
jgi:hypothetical protein